jgi:hypothetical protein
MPYTIYNGNGTTTVTIPDNVIDTTFYDTTNNVGVQIAGRNAINYGQPLGQNLLQMLQNFAGPNRPLPIWSQQGQLWFDTTNQTMNVKFSTSGPTDASNWAQFLTVPSGGGSVSIPGNLVVTGNITGANLSGINTGDQTITLSGDATGTGTSGITVALATVNTSPQTLSFTKTTINGKGLVTATTPVVSSDITTALGYTPFNASGGTLTGPLNWAPDVTLASAATVNIGAAGSNNIIITGSTTITAFDAIANGAIRSVRFTGGPVLTYNAVSMILPSAANIAVSSGDTATFESLGSGNWICTSYTRANGQALVGGGSGSFTGGTLVTALNYAPDTTLASAATVNIGSANVNNIIITGTTTISAFDAIVDGATRNVRFTGVLTLVYNSTSMILPSTANIVTAPNDCAVFESLGGGNWICTSYTRANGQALVGGSGAVTGQTLTYGATINWNQAAGTLATVTLTGASATFANPTGAVLGTQALIVFQDSTGGRTITWGSNFQWAAGTAPVLSTAAGAKDLITFLYDGTHWIGSYLRGVA